MKQASYPSTHQLMVFDVRAPEAIVESPRHAHRRHALSLAASRLLPDGAHYAVTGHWENMFVLERGSHRLVRELRRYPMFFGHSYITSACSPARLPP